MSEKGDHNFWGNLANMKCEGNTGEPVEQEEKLCDEVETVREYTYLGAGGGCCDCKNKMRVG